MGLISKNNGRHSAALECFQRAIYSQEEKAGAEKLPVSYINIGYLLVESAKQEIDTLKTISQQVNYHLLKNKQTNSSYMGYITNIIISG